MVHNAAYDTKHRKGLKILTSKQMLQRLPLVLAQLKASNTSKNVINEVRQIIYCYVCILHKEKYKKVIQNLKYQL